MRINHKYYLIIAKQIKIKKGFKQILAKTNTVTDDKRKIGVAITCTAAIFNASYYNNVIGVEL